MRDHEKKRPRAKEEWCEITSRTEHARRRSGERSRTGQIRSDQIRTEQNALNNQDEARESQRVGQTEQRSITATIDRRPHDNDDDSRTNGGTFCDRPRRGGQEATSTRRPSVREHIAHLGSIASAHALATPCPQPGAYTRRRTRAPCTEARTQRSGCVRISVQEVIATLIWIRYV